MVRAGVVDHPREWPFGSYAEIMSSRQRYRLIDRPMLLQFLGIRNDELLKSAYDSWIRERLSRGPLEREAIWTDSIAVGEASFVREFKKKLGIRANSREIAMADGEGSFILREGEDTYGGNYRGKNEVLSKRDKFKKIINDL
jgi:putative transposase